MTDITTDKNRGVDVNKIKIGLPLVVILIAQVAAGSWVLKGYDNRISNTEMSTAVVRSEVEDIKKEQAKIMNSMTKLETYLETIIKWIDKQED